MSSEPRYSIEEAHFIFAKQFNGRVWELLEKESRTLDEDEEMVLAAYASYYHWLHAGGGAHRQRSEWLLARVYTVLGQADQAIIHAQRCLTLTEGQRHLLQDFDVAYAYEAMARAYALSKDKAQALEYRHTAQAAGERIGDAEDRRIFQDDLEGGDWYGVD